MDEGRITESGVRETTASARAALKKVRSKITGSGGGSANGHASPPAPQTEPISTEQAIQALKACRARGDTSRKSRAEQQDHGGR